MKLTRKHLDTLRTIAIYAAVGEGKTALAYTILELLKDKEIFFFRHPRPELIAELGYKNLTNLEGMENMQDCVVYLDEIQLHIGIYDKKSNAIIGKICSLARQRNITLIISSSDTRVFGKANEAFFDLWLVKAIDFDGVKQGSKIKNILKWNSFIDPAGIQIRKDEFLSHCRAFQELNGRDNFIMPQYFTEAHSKPYRLQTPLSDVSAFHSAPNEVATEFIFTKLSSENKNEIPSKNQPESP